MPETTVSEAPTQPRPTHVHIFQVMRRRLELSRGRANSAIIGQAKETTVTSAFGPIIKAR